MATFFNCKMPKNTQIINNPKGPVIQNNTGTKSSEWISVKDRRPENEGKYLVASSYGVTLAFYHTWTGKGVFQDASEHCDEGMENMDEVVFKVTHWMPLPEMPEVQP